MQDLNKKAKILVQFIEASRHDDAIEYAKKALLDAYNTGKKHLFDPSHLMGEDSVVKEIDTFNPIH